MVGFSKVMRMPSTERSRGTSPTAQFTCNTAFFVTPDIASKRIRNTASPPVGITPKDIDKRLWPNG
jgi:hypothetical protein